MSYDYSPSMPPHNPEAFRAWVYDELRKVSSNFLYQREGWNDLRVPVTSTKLGGSKDPGFSQVKDNGSGSQGVFAYVFSKATEEELYFITQLPHGRVNNSALRPHIHWSPTDTDTGTVRWGLEYTIANVNGTFGNTTLIYCEDAGDGTADKHQVKGFAEISGSGIKDSAALICRVFRDAGHANDTYDNDAALLDIDFHVLLQRHGSDEEYGGV